MVTLVDRQVTLQSIDTLGEETVFDERVANDSEVVNFVLFRSELLNPLNFHNKDILRQTLPSAKKRFRTCKQNCKRAAKI